MNHLPSTSQITKGESRSFFFVQVGIFGICYTQTLYFWYINAYTCGNFKHSKITKQDHKPPSSVLSNAKFMTAATVCTIQPFRNVSFLTHCTSKGYRKINISMALAQLDLFLLRSDFFNFSATFLAVFSLLMQGK